MTRSVILLCAVLLGASTSGCATLFEGKYQEFTVNTISDNAPKSTQCVLKNEEGEWRAWANISTVIHRDGNVMSIECENDDQIAKATLRPAFQAGYVLLDILWDYCILTASCIIDGATNAFYEYPTKVSVEMRSKQDARSAVQEALAIKPVSAPAEKEAQDETSQTP